MQFCRYCRARGRCRARAEKNVELAFRVKDDPALLTFEEMGKYLKDGQDVAKWLKDIEASALEACLSGKEIPGWKAVAGRATRDWTDMDAAFARLEEAGIRTEVLWERKPLTLAQVEKIIGKKEFAANVGEFVTKKNGKPALVEDSDKRPAITNKISAAEAFKEETDHE